MLHLLILTLLFLQPKAYGGDFRDFDNFQHQLTAPEVETKIKSFLEKDPSSLSGFYRLTPEALYIGDFEQQQIDYILYFAPNLTSTPKSRSSRSLEKVKIALDPGHFGGAFAKLEERYVSIPAEKTAKNQPIDFNEGTLTYLTALKLQEMLEAEGAVVYITRPGIGQGAISDSFFEWLGKQPHLWEKECHLSHLFRKYYNQEDLRVRAQNINAFAPDLTLLIHYNAHPSPEFLSSANYNLVFIPGAFCPQELNSREDRYEFLRMVVTDDVERSYALSEAITAQFVQKLALPLMEQKEKTPYTHASCIFQAPGIYSRNLTLTRLVHGPLCYGETLIQNNVEEVVRLSTQEIQIAGYAAPKRVEEVAQAYFEGIKNYFLNCSSACRTCKAE